MSKENTAQKITIFGIGGIGGYMAGKLSSLAGSEESSLGALNAIARGEHLRVIREKGLLFISPGGKETLVRPSAATDDPAAVPDTDIWILCVKGYGLNAAVDAISPLVKKDTIVLPLLNGADISDRVRDRLPAGIVLPGGIYISSAMAEPGTVHQIGGKGMVIAGRDPKHPDFLPETLISLLEQAGIPLQWQDDPSVPIWTKYLFIAPFSLVTAVSGKTIGGVLADTELKASVRTIMEEVISVAKAHGVSLAPDGADQSLSLAAGFPPETKTSFQRDVENRSPRDERDLFSGTILRLGIKYGIPTPETEKFSRELP